MESKFAYELRKSGLGVLGIVSRRWAGRLPFIAKLNHNQLLGYPEQYRQSLYGSVRHAFDLGAIGIGATVYFGSTDANRELEQIASLFEEAHQFSSVTARVLVCMGVSVCVCSLALPPAITA